MRSLVSQNPKLRVTTDVTSSLGYALQVMRAPVIIPLLQLAMLLCSLMSIMLFIERVYMALIIICVKLLGKKRYTKYKLENMREDLEFNKSYPMVLVQIPMYNEKEVYRLSIGAACALSWPSDCLIIQVLDDSTNQVLREMVELECKKWIQNGVNVKYETRNNRNGYKAGALKEGLDKQYVKDCEFVVIFDADFQPDEDFLWRTIPYMLENPELGLVQARWKFGKIIFKAYRFQQHRWSCGPANLFRKMTKEILLCERVSIWKRLHLIYAFFFVRKIVAHWVTFFFYCIIIPASVLVPELHLTKPIAIYIPATITILNAVCTPRSLHLVVFWILFENVMSLHRTKAAIIGLLEANRVNEWVVTEKLGNTMKQKNAKKSRFRIGEKFHFLELIMGGLLLHCAIYDLMNGKDHFFIYLFLQSGAFFIMGFGYVGTFVPT
nr:glucomannan 4-beta-mannosyltransferase 1-like isoform X3 [Ziziphus jujuba var. spinosa]